MPRAGSIQSIAATASTEGSVPEEDSREARSESGRSVDTQRDSPALQWWAVVTHGGRPERERLLEPAQDVSAGRQSVRRTTRQNAAECRIFSGSCTEAAKGARRPRRRVRPTESRVQRVLGMGIRPRRPTFAEAVPARRTGTAIRRGSRRARGCCLRCRCTRRRPSVPLARSRPLPRRREGLV